MGDNQARVRCGPVRIETIRGEPYSIGKRKLMPIARFVSLGEARATIATKSIGGWGWAWTQLAPVAVFVQGAEGEERIALVDQTSRIVFGLVGASIVLSLLLGSIRWAVRRLRR